MAPIPMSGSIGHGQDLSRERTTFVSSLTVIVVSAALVALPLTQASLAATPIGINGATHAADAVALQAKEDLTTSFNVTAGQATDFAAPLNLGGQVLVSASTRGTASLVTPAAPTAGQQSVRLPEDHTL